MENDKAAETAPETAPGTAPSPGNGYKWRAMGIVITGTFMAILDNSIVNVALPHMMANFGTDIERIKWVATAYMIAYGVVVLTTNYLGKRFGQERVYVWALGLFTVGSFLCGKAWDINSMIAFRAFQAVGGGLMLPTGMTIITKAFKPQERGTAFGVFGLVILLAPVLGPTLGGYLVDRMNWQWIFYVNIPVGLAAIPMAMITLKKEPPEGRIRFDLAGFLGLGMALTMLLIAISKGERWGWDSPSTIACFATAAVGFFLFVIVDLYIKDPIIDLTVFTNFSASILFTMSFFRAVSLFGRTLFVSLFLQQVQGYTALVAGILLIPGALVAGICTPIFGKLADKIGAKFLIIAGAFITGYSLWMYRDLSVGAPREMVIIPMLVFGVGMGMVTSPMMSSIMNVVKPSQVGVASMLQTVIMQVGGAYGINILEVFIDGRQSAHFQQQLESFTGSIFNHTGRWIASGPLNLGMGKAALTQAQILLYNQGTSAAWAYDDAFIVLAIMSAITGLLGFFYSSPKHHPHAPGAPKAEEPELLVEAG